MLRFYADSLWRRCINLLSFVAGADLTDDLVDSSGSVNMKICRLSDSNQLDTIEIFSARESRLLSSNCDLVLI